MKLSLKAQNRPLIIAFALAFGALLWWIIEPYDLENLAVLDDLYSSVVFVGVASIFTLAVSEIVPARAKLALVYWKLKNPTPGSRAFSKIMHEDFRIDPQALERKHGPLPMTPEEQDKKFYSIYKPLDEEISVQDAHKSYLLFRELTCISIVFGLSGSAAAFILSTSLVAVGAFLGISILLYLICSISAQQAGKRLVANVLAVASVK